MKTLSERNKQENAECHLKVTVFNYDADRLAEKMAKAMAPIVQRMIHDEYLKEIK
jgi:hypothetical protein